MSTIDSRAAFLLKRSHPDLYMELGKIAAEHDVSISFLVSEAVKNYLGEDKKARRDALLDMDARIRKAKDKALEEANLLQASLHAPRFASFEDLPDGMNGWTAHFS